VTRARLRPVDIWDENDPAVLLLREALALKPPPEPVGRPETADNAPTLVPASAESRRDRIAALVARVRAGDLAAVELLRALLAG